MKWEECHAEYNWKSQWAGNGEMEEKSIGQVKEIENSMMADLNANNNYINCK